MTSARIPLLAECWLLPNQHFTNTPTINLLLVNISAMYQPIFSWHIGQPELYRCIVWADTTNSDPIIAHSHVIIVTKDWQRNFSRPQHENTRQKQVEFKAELMSCGGICKCNSSIKRWHKNIMSHEVMNCHDSCTVFHLSRLQVSCNYDEPF